MLRNALYGSFLDKIGGITHFTIAGSFYLVNKFEMWAVVLSIQRVLFLPITSEDNAMRKTRSQKNGTQLCNIAFWHIKCLIWPVHAECERIESISELEWMRRHHKNHCDKCGNRLTLSFSSGHRRHEHGNHTMWKYIPVLCNCRAHWILEIML